MNSLRFRRQFLLAHKPIKDLSNWIHHEFTDDLILHIHPDLEYTARSHSHQTVVIIGYIFDPMAPKNSNEAILDDLFDRGMDFPGILKGLSRKCGRFVLFHHDTDETTVVSDPLGLREIYYCETNNEVVCGSQPNLINQYSSPFLGITKDKNVRKFKEHDLKVPSRSNYWIGTATYFSSVKHMPPNHALQVESRKTFRYWPTSRLPKKDLSTVVNKSVEFLQGIIDSAQSRRPLSMAITAGLDSRTLLAMARQHAQGIHLFVNQHPFQSSSSPDIAIPKRITKHLGLEFHVNNIPPNAAKVDKEYREIYFQNTFLARNESLQAIAFMDQAGYGAFLNLCGVGEIGRTRFVIPKGEIDHYRLAYLYGHRYSPYAVDQCEKWLKDNSAMVENSGLNPLTLFYWEVDLGNWGATENSFSDIAYEEFNPYNSHYLLELFLSLDPEFTTYDDNILFREIIQASWPELLQFPTNPPEKFRTRVMGWIRKLGLFPLMSELRYQYHRRKFYRTHKN